MPREQKQKLDGIPFKNDVILHRAAKEVKVAVLLDKPGKRKAAIEADIVGFSCADVFVVGYGMDAAHAYRELPFVGVVTD